MATVGHIQLYIYNIWQAIISYCGWARPGDAQKRLQQQAYKEYKYKRLVRMPQNSGKEINFRVEKLQRLANA